MENNLKLKKYKRDLNWRDVDTFGKKAAKVGMKIRITENRTGEQTDTVITKVNIGKIACPDHGHTYYGDEVRGYTKFRGLQISLTDLDRSGFTIEAY